METMVINGISLEVEDRDGKRYVRKPAGGAGGGVTGAVLEYVGPTPALVLPAAASVTLPQADAQAIEAAVEKAEADAHNES